MSIAKTRQEKGLELAEGNKVHPIDNGVDVPYWMVDGSKSGIQWTVRYNAEIDELECNCPDFRFRGNVCKHIVAVKEVWTCPQEPTCEKTENYNLCNELDNFFPSRRNLIGL